MSAVTVEDESIGVTPADREDRSPTRRPRRMRTGIVAAAVVALAAGGVIALRSDAFGSAPTTTTPTAAPTATAVVTRRDLVDRVTVDGTLGYGATTALTGPMGTVTGVVAVGTVVERGQPVGQVDGLAVPLLYGTVPLWRPLSGASAKGADIRMLEENLQALGYADGLVLTVDDQWDDATLVAVQRWQAALGREQTGTVQPGDAVVHDGPARIAKLGAAVGQSPPGGGGLVEVTGTTRQVEAEVKASQQTLVHVGDPVRIELPGGATTTGRIVVVGTVATAEESEEPGGGAGDATVAVTITIDDLAAVGTLDQAPVSVQITAGAASDVLAVPVNALLALREGGYAVEVRRGSATVLVGVVLGAFADGWVQIDGELREGETVLVPK